MAPWSKKISEAQGRISVATTERDTLARKAEDAKKRLEAALKTLQVAQQNAAGRQKHIQELEASIVKCR